MLNPPYLIARSFSPSKPCFCKRTGHDLGNITVSVSVSEIREEDTAISVVERADAALYLAKDSGRNNVKSEIDLESAETGT